MKVKTRSATMVEYPSTQVICDTSTQEADPHSAYASCAGGNPVTYDSVSAGASSISYDSGKNFNNCLHEYDKLEINMKYVLTPYVRTWYVNSQQLFRNSLWKGIHEPILPPEAPITSVTGEMRRRAWDAVYPEINDGLQLAVSIFEFRDFPRMMKTAKRLAKVFTSLRNARRTNLKELMNDTFLSYNFGVMPMLSDLDGLANDLLKLRKHVNEFIQKGLQPASYHYKETVSYHSTEEERYNGVLQHEVKCMYYATVKLSYVYDLPPKWELIMRVGGLRLTPSTVWNAIPWSFVVDWLVDVTDFLEQFDRDPRVTVKVHDYCDTIKNVSQHSYRRTKSSAGWSNYKWPPWGSDVTGPVQLDGIFHGGGENTPLWTWKRVHYNRTPGQPDMGYALPVLDSLSNRQLVLAGALLAAQR